MSIVNVCARSEGKTCAIPTARHRVSKPFDAHSTPAESSTTQLFHLHLFSNIRNGLPELGYFLVTKKTKHYRE